MRAIAVGTARAEPGERTYGWLTVGELANGGAIDVPIAIVNGKDPGPRLYVGAAVHGDEVNSIDVLRQTIPHVDPRILRGSIISAIVVNPPAFQYRRRSTPHDNEDMNRVWPGKPEGKLAERMAHAIFSQAIAGADVVVDLHTAATNMVIHVVYAAGDGASREFALAFGTQVVLEERRDETWQSAGFGGKLRSVMTDRGVPAITPELGRTGGFQQAGIQAGVRGVMGVLAHANMLEVRQSSAGSRTVLSGSHLDSITASRAGLFVAETSPGTVVEEGQRVGYLYQIADFDIVEEFRSPFRGMVLSLVDNPVIDTGGYIATVSRIKSAHV